MKSGTENHTAFVAGATGLTGRHVVEALSRRGIPTRAHVRPDNSKLDEWRSRFGALEGVEVDASPWEPAAIEASLTEHAPTLVFGLLGTTRARASAVKREGGDPNLETYARVDVGMTKMVMDACAKLSPAPRFVYLSSIGAGPGARGAYLQARTEVEQALMERAGLPYTIARPSFIVGDRDVPRAGEKVGSAIANAGLALVGALGGAKVRDRYSSISGEELAAGLVRIALDPAWVGRVAEAADLRPA